MYIYLDLYKTASGGLVHVRYWYIQCTCTSHQYIYAQSLSFQESVLAEKEQEWNGLQTKLNEELERVKGELEESRSQCTQLKEASEKVG